MFAYRAIFLVSCLTLLIGFCTTFATGKGAALTSSVSTKTSANGLSLPNMPTGSTTQPGTTGAGGSSNTTPNGTKPQAPNGVTTTPSANQSFSSSTEPPPTTGPTPSVEVTPTPQAADGSVQVLAAEPDQGLPDDIPASFYLLVIVLCCLVGVAVIAAVAYWRAWQPRWWGKAGHACAEASWRLSLGWNEFLDWLRVGR